MNNLKQKSAEDFMTKMIKNMIQGASTIFSITPPPRHPPVDKLYNPYRTASEALASDWKRVGGDINKVMQLVEHGKK